MHKSGGGAIRELIRLALVHDDSAHLMHRLDCVLLIAEGRSLQGVADWFGVDRRTIRRWVHAAYESGITGLAEHHNGGRPTRLTGEQMQSIRLDLLASPQACGYPDPHWTGKRLALHLYKCYTVKMSVRSCQRMIARSRTGTTGRS